MKKSIESNSINEFCRILQSLFANIPYNLHIGEERYYHSLFQLLGNLLSLEIDSEVPTDKGRIDLVIKTKTHIYLFEVKLNTKVEKALEQINEKRYYEKYIIDNKQLVLVGLSFNKQKNKLSLSCKAKEL